MKSLPALVFCLNFMPYCSITSMAPETPQLIQHTATSVSTGVDIFRSPQELFEQNYAFLYTNFYKIDPFFYEKNLENPLNLSTDFMVQCLSELYAQRMDMVCQPVNKSVDAIIEAGFSEGSMYERFVALKKSMEEYKWRFNKIHVFVSDMPHAETCKKILTQLFPNDHHLLPINWIFTHCSTGIFLQGLKLLKLSDQLAPYYVIIDRSIQFSEKHVFESRRILYDKTICLGAHVIQTNDWLESAKIHSYHKLYSNYNDMVCAWFHAEMNFYVRRLHHHLVHQGDIMHKENYLSALIKQKYRHHDLEESYYFKKLSALYLNKALTIQHKTSRLFALLRSLGLLLYAQQNCASRQYDLTQQLAIIKEALIHDLDKNILNRLFQKSGLDTGYKKELKLLCNNSIEKYRTMHRDDIHLLYKEISNSREALLKKIIMDSIDVVGVPPCRFTFILAGSSARKEATPWSDVEFGLLVEQRNEAIDDYFFKLNAIIFNKIINIGKMPIYNCDIVSLNRFSLSGENLPFFDYVIPAGFALDRLSGGFLPLSEKDNSSCYGTPAQLSEIVSSWQYPTITVDFLHGDMTLFLEYKNRKNWPELKQKSYDLLKTEIPLFSKIVREITGQIDIKNTFYRPFTRVLESLGVYYDLNVSSSCERIEALRISGYISLDEAKTLQEFLKKTVSLRFALNMKNKQRFYGYCDSVLKVDVECLLASKDGVDVIFKHILKQITSFQML